MRNSPLLLGAIVAFACSACGGATAPSDPPIGSGTSGASQSASGGGAGATGDGTAAAGGGGGGGAAAGSGAGTPGAGTPGAGQPATGTAPISGSFGGSYHVPTTPVLDAAATFDVTEFTWTVSGNVATLAYNLPRALVGKLVRVVFTGPFDPVTGRRP
jgi:hypothetical protein